MFRMIQAIALILTLTASTAATKPIGGVSIYNDCKFPVYSYTVTQGGGVQKPIKLPSGHWTHQKYQYPKEGGMVMKLAKEAELGSVPITQLEYSVKNDIIYYDVSNVDCGPTGQSNKGECPFLHGGMFLHSSPGCTSKTCRSGDKHCHDAYNLPDDNWAVGGCAFKNQNLVLYVCRDKKFEE